MKEEYDNVNIRGTLGLIIIKNSKILQANDTIRKWLDYPNLDKLKQLELNDLFFKNKSEIQSLFNFPPNDHFKLDLNIPMKLKTMHDTPLKGKIVAITPTNFEGEKSKQMVIEILESQTIESIKQQLQINQKQLHERVKELNCLYSVSKITSDITQSKSHVLQQIANEIPPGWNYPAITHCKILVDDKEYTSEDFIEGSWSLKHMIKVNSIERGKIIVYYSEKMPELDHGPFLTEELDLIENLATEISRFIERKEQHIALKEAENRLRRSEKLETIGRLAGGVVHDFNNILTIIKNNTEIALSQIKDNSSVYSSLNEIKNSTIRATALAKQLLTYTQQDPLEFEVINLNNVISPIMQLVEKLVPENIEFNIDLDENIGNIEANTVKIEQIILNLVTNASDAQQPNGGVVEIRTSNSTLNGNKCVLLAVKDQGSGIRADNLDNLFQPFYTTKSTGIGLGLTTVYNHVQSVNGKIEVNSVLNEGTEFKIKIPITQMEPHSTSQQPKGIDHIDFKDMTILVVEDEISIQNLLAKQLEKIGFNVIIASNGQIPLSYDEDKIKNIDLIITDVVMPKLNGKSMVENLRQINPQVKVIYQTGFRPQDLEKYGKLDEGPLINKPYSFDELAMTIGDMLSKEFQ